MVPGWNASGAAPAVEPSGRAGRPAARAESAVLTLELGLLTEGGHGPLQEAVEEALKLESALARLRTQKRVALLHYSPIRATVEGEPPEIFAYLGSSRLEEPINLYRVSAVFHGHAHRGSP